MLFNYHQQIDKVCCNEIDSREALTGVLYNGKEFVATNGHVLAIIGISQNEQEEIEDIIIPQYVFRTLREVIKKNKDKYGKFDVKISITNSSLKIFNKHSKLENEIFFESIKQKYLRYKEVIPDEKDCKLISEICFSLEELDKLAKVFNDNNLRFTFNGDNKGIIVKSSLQENIIGLIMPRRIN